MARLIDKDEAKEVLTDYYHIHTTIQQIALEEAFSRIPIVEAIPIKQLLSILPKYDDYVHTKTYPYNETMEDIYSKGHEEGWNACLKAIKEELDYWGKENG